MAEFRTASDDTILLGGTVAAAWLAGLASLVLFFSIGPRGAPASALVHPAVPAEAAAHTLPPPVVVAARADAFGPGCMPEHGRPDHRCTSAHREVATAHLRPDPPRDDARASLR